VQPAAGQSEAAAAAGKGRLKRFFAVFRKPACAPSNSTLHTAAKAVADMAGAEGALPPAQQQQEDVQAAELAKLQQQQQALQRQLLEHVRLMLAGRPLLQRLRRTEDGLVEPAEVLWGVYESVSFEWIRARQRAGKLSKQVVEVLGPRAGASLGPGSVAAGAETGAAAAARGAAAQQHAARDALRLWQLALGAGQGRWLPGGRGAGPVAVRVRGVGLLPAAAVV
jgi:hypothetical protein